MSMKVTKEEFIGVTYDELLAENAKLYTQLADVTESMGRVEERCAKTFEVGKRWMAKAARFEAENAKLRKLVADMWFWHYEGHIDSESQERQMLHIDAVIQRMRELGVEVDE